MFQNSFPLQRLPFNEKLTNDRKWAKDIINFIANYHVHTPTLVESQREMDANYKLFNNILDQKDFEMECNPLGLSVGQFQDEIKPYNKTYNKIQVLLGEELKRPFNYKAVLISQSGIKSKMRKKEELMHEYLNAEIQATLAEAKAKVGNLPPEEAQQAAQKLADEVMDPAMIDKYMATTFQESQEILSNKILDYLMVQQDIKSKKNDAFKHGLISDHEFAWVGLENGNPVVNVLNPRSTFYHKSPEIKFIEEGLYAGYKTRMSTIDVLNLFGDYLSPKDIERIEGHAAGGYGGEIIPGKEIKYSKFDPHYQFQSNLMTVPMEGSYGAARSLDHIVMHVEWKSERKVGILEFINEYGDQETTLVTEDFVVPDYATTSISTDTYGTDTKYYEFDGSRLTWTWVPEIWNGIRINNDVYCQVGPKPFQYRSIENPKENKLGYHGVVYSNMNAQSCSLMTRMKPFQYLYFIIMHKIKRLIARDKGQATGIDTSMIDPKIGLDKTMYYLEEMDINFYNSLANAENRGAASRSGKVGATVQRSNAQHIMNYISLLESIDNQISDVAGVSRGREGQTSPSEAVTNAQQNLNQSATITESYFYLHNRVWANVLTSLLEVAQFAWKDKHILRQWVLDDASVASLEIKPGDITNEALTIFVQDSSKQHRAFEFAERHFQELLQNDKTKFSTMLEMFQTNSLSEFTRTVKQQERQQEQAAQQQQQAEQQAQAEALQNAKDMVILKGNIDKEIEQMKIDGKIQEAEIKSFMMLQDQDSDNNGIPDQFEIAKFETEAKLKQKALNLQEKKQTTEERQRDEEIAIKKKIANKARPSS